MAENDIFVAGPVARQDGTGPNRMVSIDRDRAMLFYTSFGVAGEVLVAETADAGVSWGSSVIDTANGFYISLGVWYSRWTRGVIPQAEENVHICYANNGGNIGLYYKTVDVSGATTPGSAVQVDSISISAETTDRLQICELTNGDLWIMHLSAGSPLTTRLSMYRSQNGGATWTTIFQETGTSALFGVGKLASNFANSVVMIPAPGFAEFFSPWVIVYNENDREVYVTILLPPDLLSFSAFDIATFANGDGAMNKATVLRQAMAVGMRHSDGKVFLGFFDNNIDALNVLQFWKLTEVNNHQRQTNVLEAPIPGPYAGGLTMMIDQSRGTLLLAYTRGTAVQNVRVFWQESINGGLTWTGELAQMEDSASDIDAIQCPMSSPGNAAARFQVAMWNDNNDEYRSSALNNAPVAGYTVSNAGPDTTIVECATGKAAGQENDLILKRGYQNYQLGRRQLFISLAASKAGSIAVGDPVVGATSGATGIFLGWNEDFNRIHIGDVKVGSKSRSDTPFLPNETIHLVGNPAINVTVAASPGAAAEDISIPPIAT